MAAYENAYEVTPDAEEVSPRVRVIGVSGRGDRRLLHSVLPNDSDLVRVATGELDQARVEGDPLGSVVADRRQRPAMVLILPITAGDRTVGAAALWLAGGREPTGSVRTEVIESLANAGRSPRHGARGRSDPRSDGDRRRSPACRTARDWRPP